MNSNWSYSPETVKLGGDLCDLDLWPWPFAWTLLLSLAITPENFMMIRWWEHSQKGVTHRQTDGQTDGRTENTICRAAWSQLKKVIEMEQIILMVMELQHQQEFGSKWFHRTWYELWIWCDFCKTQPNINWPSKSYHHAKYNCNNNNSGQELTSTFH